jgi:hypothetical protein
VNPLKGSGVVAGMDMQNRFWFMPQTVGERNLKTPDPTKVLSTIPFPD